MEKRHVTLDIFNPIADCGHCHFGQALKGTWSVEDGRLVFRADADPLPSRGPDLNGCYESDSVVRFKHIEVDGTELTDAEVEALRKEAE